MTVRYVYRVSKEATDADIIELIAREFKVKAGERRANADRMRLAHHKKERGITRQMVQGEIREAATLEGVVDYLKNVVIERVAL